MCGITGIFETRGKNEIERDVLARMNESQHHRGPDEGSFHIEPGLGLGHRRLSIIDVATGQQPIFNEDGSVVIIYNGEIYNYQELIPELVALGHVFRTKSDTEVIVHAWEAWGEACVERFRGMFTFALWDRNRRNPLPRPRQAGCKAAVLRVPSRRQVHLRIRAQVAARPRRAGPRSRPAGGRGIFRAGVRSRAAHHFLRRGKAAARAHADTPAWSRSQRAEGVLGCPVYAGQPDKLRGRQR